jgi:hypothetical protein
MLPKAVFFVAGFAFATPVVAFAGSTTQECLSAAAVRIQQANPGAPSDIVGRAALMVCGLPVPSAVPLPEPLYRSPAGPIYTPPPVSGPTTTNCMPFGNGGTRCTIMTPGQAPRFTTCYPFGNGETRCTTQ